MDKLFYCGIGLLFGASIGIAGTGIYIEQLSKSRMPKPATAIVDRKDILGDVGKGFSSCPIQNLTKQKIVVKVVNSKFTSGTYFVEPKERALLSCGDEVQIVGTGFIQKHRLSKPIVIQVAEKQLGTEI
jgi:hypothetical protein